MAPCVFKTDLNIIQRHHIYAYACTVLQLIAEKAVARLGTVYIACIKKQLRVYTHRYGRKIPYWYSVGVIEQFALQVQPQHTVVAAVNNIVFIAPHIVGLCA